MNLLSESYKQDGDFPASKAIFESGWLKLFSVGFKKKGLLTHGEHSGMSFTLSHSFLSQSSYSQA